MKRLLGMSVIAVLIASMALCVFMPVTEVSNLTLEHFQALVLISSIILLGFFLVLNHFPNGWARSYRHLKRGKLYTAIHVVDYGRKTYVALDYYGDESELIWYQFDVPIGIELKSGSKFVIDYRENIGRPRCEHHNEPDILLIDADTLRFWRSRKANIEIRST